jgi:TonB family protein
MTDRTLAGIFSFCLHSLLLGGLMLMSWKGGGEEEKPIHVIWEEKKVEQKIAPPSLKQEKKKSVKPALAPQKVETRKPQQVATSQVAGEVRHQQTPQRRAFQPLPSYPWVCRKRGQEGMVAIFVRTNEEGKVIESKVQTSSGYDLLDEAALKVIQRWVLAEGSVQKTFSIVFRLNG